MAKVILDVLVEGKVVPTAYLNGSIGGTCGSRYCQCCRRFRGEREEAPVRKVKTAKGADPKGQRKRPAQSRARTAAGD